MDFTTHKFLSPATLGTDTVKETTKYSTNYWGYFMLSGNTIPDGGWYNNQWLSQSGVYTNQKVNIDMLESVSMDGFAMINSHNVGGSTNTGVRNLTIYQTTEQTAFENVNFADLTDLVEIASYELAEFTDYTYDYYEFPSTINTRYLVLRMADCWGASSYMGIRSFYPVTPRDVPVTILENFLIGDTSIHGIAPNNYEDPDFSRRHFLGGSVKVNGLPARKRIVVFDRKTLAPLMSKWSLASNGLWAISNTEEHPEEGLYAIAFDESGEFNAEIFDRLSQVQDTRYDYRDWTPLDLGGTLMTWIDPSDASTITLDGTDIAQINDKSGNGKHLTQTVKEKMPSYVGGRMLFSDVSILEMPNYDYSLQNLAMVFEPDATKTDFIIIHSIDSNGVGSTSYFAMRGASVDSNLYQYSSATPYADGVQLTNSSLELYNITTGKRSIGALSNWEHSYWMDENGVLFGAGDAGNFEGYIDDIIITRDTSSFTRQLIEGFLAHKNGTAGDLSATHPYKTAPPQIRVLV